MKNKLFEIESAIEKEGVLLKRACDCVEIVGLANDHPVVDISTFVNGTLWLVSDQIRATLEELSRVEGLVREMRAELQ